MYLGAYTYGYIRTDPSRLRKRRKSAFHKRAEPAYYNYRESRSYLPYEYSSISLSPEPLLVALHLVLFLPCVLPFLSSLSAVSNLYRRCRTPPATGQIIHYGARACTRHVARGEARPREMGERCGGRAGGS